MKKILAILLVVVACSGEKDDPQPSRTELLTSVPKWELVSIDSQEPHYNLILAFNADGSVVYDMVDDGSTTGQWSLLQNEQVLQIAFSSSTLELPIVKLTSTELIYRGDQNKEHLFNPL